MRRLWVLWLGRTCGRRRCDRSRQLLLQQLQLRGGKLEGQAAARLPLLLLLLLLAPKGRRMAQGGAWSLALLLLELQQLLVEGG